jgi:uncharacterized protein YeaO (DUF488 family)
VRKNEYAKRDYFDLWFPELAPSQKLFGYASSAPLTPQRWTRFSKGYLLEMRKPGPQRILALLARFSLHTNFSVGCYCEDARRCHRSLLGELLEEHGAKIKT